MNEILTKMSCLLIFSSIFFFERYRLLSGSTLNHPSLVQSPTLDQRIKTVQCPKQFYSLFWGPSLSITDQDQGRDILGDTNPLRGQL